jgi:hypothetical protein
MKSTAQVRINLINQAQSLVPPGTGVMYMVGETSEGPINSPDKLIRNWTQFVDEFGGLQEGNLFPLMCFHALREGATLRIARVTANQTETDIVSTPLLVSSNTGDPLFTLEAKEGYNGGDLWVVLTNTTSGIQVGVWDTDTGVALETHSIILPNTGTVPPYNYLAPLSGSVYIQGTYGVTYPTQATFHMPVLDGVNLSGGTSEDTAALDVSSVNGVPLFTLMAKGDGDEGNDITVTLTPSSDGLTFDLLIQAPGETDENYTDLEVPLSGTEPPYVFLSQLDTSSIVDYAYEDVSLEVTPPVVLSTDPEQILEVIITSLDTVTLKDYSDAFDSFDDYDDGWAIAAPAKDELSLVGLYATGNSYASKRKDIVYLQNIPNSLATESAITTHLKTFNTSKWAGFIGGGLKIVDGSETVNVPALGAVMGLIASVHSSLAPWRNPTNYAAGRISQGVGVVNNFGSPARLAFLNGIAQEGGNMVVRKGNTVMLWDFYSMDEANSPDKFLSVVFLQVYMRRALTPVLESFLGLPNTFETWSMIYYTVKPFLDSLVDNQALVDYRWDGDQFAGSMQALQINTPTEVGQGKYKVQLQMKVVVPMVDITVNIVMTENSVDFS